MSLGFTLAIMYIVHPTYHFPFLNFCHSYLDYKFVQLLSSSLLLNDIIVWCQSANLILLFPRGNGTSMRAVLVLCCVATEDAIVFRRY
jgi:hypothetical protein